MGSSNDIAIVGMGIHCPGAKTPDEFWRNLRDGVESVEFLSDQQLLDEGVSEHELANPNYVKAGAFLDGLADFDAEFFGLSPKEAAIMDPQHRHFLEVCWEALEDAGHPPTKFNGSIGVFGGCGMGTYMMYNLITNPELLDSVGYFAVRHTGNDKDFLATRVSYALNLTGPSINVQTACSTSLVAAHMAAQSLLLGECDLALAGGVTIEIPHRRGYVYREREILSPDGHCRALDHRSKGTIFGSGAAVVTLRRLDDALRDGDQIYAIIKGSAVNNDGSLKVGYLAPSVEGQAQAVAEALAVSGVPPETIGYVEAHGTGTPVGDPIEITALTQAYRAQTSARGFCGIGSVKSNIGHLDTAAGVAGLIKAALALKHRKLPPTLNWEAPNPAIDFDNSPFYVNHRLSDWPERDTPRRAAVNSLGVGGTNAHLILEEAPRPSATASAVARDRERSYLLRLSGRSPAALNDNAKRLAAFLRQHPETSLADVETTLRDGRQDFAHRRVLACRSSQQAIQLLDTNDPYRVFTHVAGSGSAAPVFLLPGGGAQYAGMAAGLYESEPVFRRAMDQCFEILRRTQQLDLRPFLFGSPGDSALTQQFERPSRQLPALMAVEYALAQLWMAWHVQPRALLGHSMGENTAACLAGVLSLHDALGLVCLRGRLFETLPEGGMISVSAAAGEVRPLLSPGLVVALENAPQLCVVSGPVEELAEFAAELTRREIEATRIPIRTAAHSPMLEPILKPFRAYLQGITLRPPRIPFVSNRTGTWITDQQATDPDYWVSHLRGTVRFSDCLATLLADLPESIYIEAGPGSTLTSLIRLQPGWGAGHHGLTSLRHRDLEIHDADFFRTALGRLWATGSSFDETQLPREGRRIRLPTYAFQHRRYWIEPGSPAARTRTESSMVSRTANFDDWFFESRWERRPLPGQVDNERHSWLVFLDELGVGAALAQRLRSAGHAVVAVSNGDRNAKLSASEYLVDSDRGAEGYEALVQGLAEDRCLPDRIVSLWTLTGAEAFRTDLNRFAHNLERSFYSLFFLLRALGQSGALAQAHLITVSNGARRVGDEPVPDPEKVTLDGPCRVATHEFEGVTCKSIDVDFSDRPAAATREKARHRRATAFACVVQQLADELFAPAGNSTIAYRDGVRYEQGYVQLGARIEPDDCLHGVRDGGTYLITGGLGGIGLTLAECMARKAKVNLLLISRSDLPARQDWTDWMERHKDDRVSRAIRAVQRLESLGARVQVGAVDVTDLEELGQFVRGAESRFGPVMGVVHAAGVVKDSLIALKTVEEVENVFAPKVYGTMVLDMVFRDHPLDFFVVFASSSTITAPAGQADYVAANAFLNGFVQSRSQREHQRLIAINWGVWNEVGMAAEATFHTDSSSVPARHPLFREQREIAGGKLISLAPLCVKHQWLLDEHRLVDGRPLLPGTSFVEIAAAALAEVSGGTTCELRDLRFLCPLTVDEGQTKRARVRLLRSEHHWEFELQSLHSTPQGRRGWLTHVQGQVAASQDSPRPAVSLAELARRFESGEELSDPTGLRTAQEDHVRFGPRWRVLRRIAFGDGEALAQLALPQPFHADLQTFHTHPALLDIATGCAMPLIDGYDPRNSVLWVPAAYGRVRIQRPLPSHIYSWIRSRGHNHVDQPTAAFDVTILDPDGHVLIEIEEFTIQQAPHEDLLASLSRIPPTALEADRPQASSGIWNTDLDPATRVLYHNVSQGILAEEGMLAFDRVIDGHAGGEIVISSLDINALKEQSARLARPAVDDVMAFERPPLDNDYVPPSTEVEQRLVEYWQEMLGIESVGIHDSFFDLGGHSLVAVRLFAKIKGQWDVSLPVGNLLEAPTIAELAKLIPQSDDRQTPTSSSPSHATGRDTQPSPWTSLVAIRKQGSRPPFFIVAGKGGNPMNLRHLAARLSEDQPVYGIQHRGVDGLLPPHESIEEMALACIADIKRVQPHGPYLLGGFSAGGLVAFEMVRALRQNGDIVALLALLDTWDPGYVEARRGERLGRHLQLLRTRGYAYFFERLAARARRFWSGGHAAGGSTPDRGAVGPLPGRITETSPQNPAMHAWTTMQDKYVARPLQAKGVLFRPYRSTGPADWTTLRAGNHYNGWDKFLLAGVEVVELPGGHSTMCEEPHVRILAKRLAKIIDDSLSKTLSDGPLRELSCVGQE